MMEDEETKWINKISTRRRPIIISLKDIPPLDPSSIPTNSSLKPRRTMMVPKQRYQETSELKLIKVFEVEQDNTISNIQIDPNSTRSVKTTQENQPLPKPEEDAKSISKGATFFTSFNEPKKGSAKSLLHEICTSKRWKPPVYDCCNVDGPCHLRFFTYKVVVEVRDFSGGTTVLECFGDPKRNKKAAAEHAAEGALWYLHHARQSCISKSSSAQMK